MSTVLVKVNTSAGDARMHRNAAPRFNRLRRTVLEHSGVDFLAVCGDVLRPAGYKSTKDGVADRSWHKTGRAFDYDQTSPALVIVSEPKAGKQYFRTYLRCADQSGKLGVKKTLRDYRGGSTNAYVFDLTAAAEAIGFKRIPAWSGWQTSYNRREFWHYQFDEGLTWAAAMAQLKGGASSVVNGRLATVGRNDRDANTGGMVTKIQTALKAAGFSGLKVDGTFGAETYNAVLAFQKAKGLDADGLVGDDTRKALKLG